MLEGGLVGNLMLHTLVQQKFLLIAASYKASVLG